MQRSQRLCQSVMIDRPTKFDVFHDDIGMLTVITRQVNFGNPYRLTAAQGFETFVLGDKYRFTIRPVQLDKKSSAAAVESEGVIDITSGQRRKLCTA